MTRFSRNNLFAFLLVMLFVVAFLNVGQIGRRGEVIDFRTFMEKVESEEIREVTIKGQEFRGKTTNDGEFRATGPRPEFQEPVYLSLVEHGVTPNFVESSDESLWVTALVTLIPVIGVGAVMIWFARNLQGANNRAMSFGKSRARQLQDSGRRVTFADVAGIDESKEELQEIVEFLKDPQKFTRLGGRIPKGVLLMGSPGTGKTLLAKAVAGEAGVPFFSISGSDFVEMFVGVGASRVRDLFDQAKKNAPCIIFIDEIDAVGRHRGAGLGGGHDEREQTLNQLLVEMDGFEGTEGVIVVAATNRPDVLDPALLRPGRFDRRVSVPNPDVKGRQQILSIHTRKIPVAEGVDLSRIAKVTPGFSGADLENLCNEAALLAARRNKTEVDAADFEEARSKIYMGPERKSLVMPEAEKQKTAYHEAGHAIVAALLPGHDPVHKVTIVPRGRALGVTWTLPEEDKLSQTREQLLQGITMAMGGRAAEEIVFNAVTGGAQSDLQRATQIARHMVCDLGMSDDLGPVAWDGGNDEVFLGRQMSRVKNYSEATAKRIDEEVRKILNGAYDAAKSILRENKHVLDKVAASLMEHESLDAEQFAQIVRESNPVPSDTAWWLRPPTGAT
jgi:cell division protease FtsH